MSPAKTVFESGTDTRTGSIFAILVVADCVFTTLTGMSGDSISGVTFTAGMTLYGNFSTVKLASGSVILYYAT